MPIQRTCFYSSARRWPRAASATRPCAHPNRLPSGAGSTRGEKSGLAAGCDAGNDAPPGTFIEIYETLFPPTTPARCGFCHSMPASDVSNGNLSTGTDQAAAYAALVEQTSTSSRCAGKPLVVPFHAEQSLLLDKLTGEPACGELMPLGGMALSDAELEVVRSWIDAGANND